MKAVRLLQKLVSYEVRVGWASSLEKLKSNEVFTDRGEIDEEDSHREKLETDYATSTAVGGKKHSLSEIWRYVENLRLYSFWRPIRDRHAEVSLDISRLQPVLFRFLLFEVSEMHYLIWDLD